jgi:hypothetical protein
MIYPIDYTEEDKVMYDNFRKLKLVEYGNNPRDYELVILNISCKHFVSNSKGQTYILTDEEQAQMANIWKTYGEPNIKYISL